MRHLGTLRYYGKRFGSFHISTYAASASFFIITAILPLLMLILSILSYTPFGTETFLEEMTRVIPPAFRGIFSFITEDLTHGDVATLSFSAIALLWTASKSMLGLLDGLNSIADVDDTRNFIFKRFICIVYMLVLILGMLLTLALRVFGQTSLTFLLKYLPHVGKVFSVIMGFRGITLFMFLALIITLIYTFFPHKKMRFFFQIPGAVFTAIAWLAFSELYSLYLERVLRTTTLYGSLGIVIFAMLWLYFCMWIIFVGAVINRIYPSVFRKAEH